MRYAALIQQLTHDKTFGAAMVIAPILLWGLIYFIPEARSSAISWPMPAVMLILIAPVIEELAFRGWLQGLLTGTRLGKIMHAGVSGQNMVTSLCFAAFHLVSHTWLWSLAVVAPSLIFGFFRDRYQSVIPAILLHAYFNGLYFIVFTQPAQ